MSRVLFFMHTASTVGGVETWLDRTCAHLDRAGFEPIVGLVRGMQFNSPDRYRQFHPSLETVEVDGSGLNRDGRVRALSRCIARQQPAIVLPLGIVDANEAVIRRKLEGQEVRLAGCAQGNLPPMLADLRDYRDWFDLVVCPGKLTQRVLVEWAGFDPGRVVNIPNGADAPVVTARPERDGPIRLGYVGRLTPGDKRALDLVPLCAALEREGVDYRLDVAGDGPCRGELEAAIGKNARVRFLGAVPHERLYREVFPSLDVLVLTSASEAFGIVLVEAMMNGVVPVTSRYHGFYSEGLVREEATGLAFPVGDMDAAAACVRRLAGNPEILHRLSAAGRAHAMEYSWGQSLDRWQQQLARLGSLPPVLAGEIPHPAAPASVGRLESLGLPASLIDAMRRMRRAALGPAVQAGGEEWPLYFRGHSPERLAEIGRVLEALDCPLPANGIVSAA